MNLCVTRGGKGGREGRGGEGRGGEGGGDDCHYIL